MASPAIVGSAATNFNNGESNTIASAAASHTTGNTLVVGIYAYNNNSATASVSSVTDTAGNTYVQRGEYAYGYNILSIWIADDITGHASNVVTVTFPASAYAFRHIAVLQYSGSPGADTGFSVSGISDTTSPATTNAGTVAANDSLVIGLYTPSGGTSFGNSGGTVRADTGGICMTDEVVAAGSRSTSVAFGVGPTIYAIAAALRGEAASTWRPRVTMIL